MKNLFNKLKYLILPRYKTVDRIELETGIVCTHILDKRTNKIRVKVDNASLTMTYGHDGSQACMSTLTAMEIGA